MVYGLNVKLRMFAQLSAHIAFCLLFTYFRRLQYVKNMYKICKISTFNELFFTLGYQNLKEKMVNNFTEKLYISLSLL